MHALSIFVLLAPNMELIKGLPERICHASIILLHDDSKLGISFGLISYSYTISCFCATPVLSTEANEWL